jgi:outer membrane lipoprotein-sorting protein
MKSSLLLVLVGVIAAASMAAQAPASKDESELLALIKEVQTQQTQIVDNQAKIEAKLADVVETIRVARLFSSRGR